MGKGKFHSFPWLRSRNRRTNVLGWQYEMIYLGGDPYNSEQAIVYVRTLEKAVVIRSSDGSEEAFRSVLIPYGSIMGVELVEKSSFGDVFEKVLLHYKDGGNLLTLELRMSMVADIYENSKLCRNMQKYVASRLK